MASLIRLGFEDPQEVLLGTTGTNANVKPARVDIGGTAYLAGLTSLNVLAIQGNNIYWQYLFASAKTDVYFAGSFNTPALSNGLLLLSFDTSSGAFSSTLNVIWNTNGSISIRRGSTVLATSASTGLIAANTKYTIECYVKPRNSGGEFTVKLGGTQVVTYSGDTTDNAESCQGFRLYNPYNSTSYWCWWDDVGANDNSGATNNTWLGVIQLYALTLTGAGATTQLDRGGLDLGANFAQVRDPDAFGLHYVQGDTDEYDLYTVDCPDLPAGATINNIIVQFSGKSVGGTGLAAAILSSNGTLGTGSDQTLTTSPIVRQEAWATDPQDSGAWTEADLATLQIGVKIRS